MTSPSATAALFSEDAVTYTREHCHCPGERIEGSILIRPDNNVDSIRIVLSRIIKVALPSKNEASNADTLPERFRAITSPVSSHVIFGQGSSRGRQWMAKSSTAGGQYVEISYSVVLPSATEVTEDGAKALMPSVQGFVDYDILAMNEKITPVKAWPEGVNEKGKRANAAIYSRIVARSGMAAGRTHYVGVRGNLRENSRSLVLQPPLPGEPGFKSDDMCLSLRALLTTQDTTEMDSIRAEPCTLRIPHLDGSIEWEFGHLTRVGGDIDDETQNAPEPFPCPGYSWCKSFYLKETKRFWRLALLLAKLHIPQQCPPNFDHEAPDGTKVKLHYQLVLEQSIKRPMRVEDAFIIVPREVDLSSGRLPAASMDDNADSNADDLAPPPAYALENRTFIAWHAPLAISLLSSVPIRAMPLALASTLNLPTVYRKIRCKSLLRYICSHDEWIWPDAGCQWPEQCIQPVCICEDHHHQEEHFDGIVPVENLEIPDVEDDLQNQPLPVHSYPRATQLSCPVPSSGRSAKLPCVTGCLGLK
ncbi:hypothetical protein U1Q18_044781 [Sarracenia purpurea var. burkii]